MMLNIKYMGKYEKESQILRGSLPENAIKFKEPDDMTEVAKKGLKVSSPILIVMLVAGILRLALIIQKTGFVSIDILLILLLTGLAVMVLFMVIHEIIHAVCFPKSAVKEIWIYPAGGALFVYCNSPVAKWKWIWMSFAPTLFLGLLPYMAGMIFGGIFPIGLTFELVYVGYIMTISGIGDFLNIYNAIQQVEPGGTILNYGFHSFWMKEDK